MLTPFADKSDEEPVIPEVRLCSSYSSSLITRYSEFGEALRGNSAIGIVKPVTNQSPQSISTKISKNTVMPVLFTDPGFHSRTFTVAAMPAYNEEKYIAKTIVKTKKYVDLVIVVDDGSSDATAEIAEALGADVIKHRTNKGYDAALQTIFKVARELDADALVILDADGQHDPKYIPTLLKPLKEGIDVVIGSRFIGDTHNEIPTYRVVGMKVLDTVTNLAADTEISDSQSGFRAYGKRAIEMIKISDNGMSAGSEILLHAKDNELSVAEVPVTVRYDTVSTSTQNPVSHGIDVLYHIIGIVGNRRPLVSFGIPGFLILLMGVVFGSWAFAEYHATTRFPFTISMISAVFLILGLLLMTTALILNSFVQIVKMERR